MIDKKLIRNFCIIAHIDHGKSTLADRLLEICGAVDKRKMHKQMLDRMDLERERGITIKAKAVHLTYVRNDKHYILNLIDTPGHVDFTAEVERCLRVLDGAVVVFSAREGVEAQSETVWRQADRYSVPRIALVNKMDREGADFESTLEEMKSRLEATPVAIQIPVGSASPGVEAAPDIRSSQVGLIASHLATASSSALWKLNAGL